MRALILPLVLAACAGRSQPSTTVRSEIELAEVAEKKRQHDVARTHYQAAVAAAKDPPSIAFARREFAETLISWGEYPEAIAQLEGVVAVKADDAASWHDLGLLYTNRGEDRRAIEALEKARSIAPADTRPRIALAALRWKRGDRAGARAEYQALLELDLPERLRTKVEWAIAELAKPGPSN